MSQPLVSIVVPVYNGEVFLKECVLSIIRQSYQNIEILLINDGSVDTSEVICLELTNLDNRVRYYYQDNLGVSSARNMGIEKSRGEWLCFVDCDDILSPNYLNSYFREIKYLKEDTLLIQHIIKKTGDSSLMLRNTIGLFSLEDFDKFLKVNNILNSGYVASKLYNVKKIRENNLFFDTRIKIAEDLLFLLNYLKHINFVFFIDDGGYIYRILENSASTKVYDLKQYLFVRKCLENNLCSISGKMKKSKEVNESLGMFAFFALQSLYLKVIERKIRISGLNLIMNSSDFVEISSFIKKRKTKNIELFLLKILYKRNFNLMDFVFNFYFKVIKYLSNVSK